MNTKDQHSFQTVCRVGEIALGEAKMFRINGTSIGVFRLGDEYFAMENECPHAGASLAHGLVDRDIVSCRIHHWRFSIRDGTYLDEDKPDCNRQSYETRLEGEHIQVLLPAIDNLSAGN